PSSFLNRCRNAQQGSTDRHSEKDLTHGVLLPGFIRGKYSKQAMRRNGAKHIIRSHGLEGGGCTREPSSRCAQLPARPARLLSKIHQRTFISKTNRRTSWRKNRSRRRATFCTSTIFA